MAALAAKHGRVPFHEFLFASVASSRNFSIRFFNETEDGSIFRYKPMFQDAQLLQLRRSLLFNSTTKRLVVHPVKHFPNAFHPQMEDLSKEDVRWIANFPTGTSEGEEA